MELGDRIRELRKSKQLTQEELAQCLGLQKSAIAKYEKGRVTNIKRETLLKMAHIFEVTPAYIIGGDEKTAGQEEIPGLKRLTGYFSQLNPRGRRKALDNLYDLTLIPAYQNASPLSLMPIAAHNDDNDPEQQRLMREDIEEL